MFTLIFGGYMQGEEKNAGKVGQCIPNISIIPCRSHLQGWVTAALRIQSSLLETSSFVVRLSLSRAGMCFDPHFFCQSSIAATRGQQVAVLWSSIWSYLLWMRITKYFSQTLKPELCLLLSDSITTNVSSKWLSKMEIRGENKKKQYFMFKKH